MMQLDELTKLKQTANTILNGIVKECRQNINENLVMPLRYEMENLHKQIRTVYVSKQDALLQNDILDK